MAEHILIIGASGRAAAFSALRAGLVPQVIDLFADADLRAVAEVRQISGRDYPHGFVEMARQVPPMPFMYTGGLENHADVIAAIAAVRPLIGNGSEVLRRVRDPFAVSIALHEAGLPCPALRRCDDPPSDGHWLCKPLHGSGGHGIRFAPAGRCRDDRFFQEFVEGESGSAIFRDGELLGVTRQLVGELWLHAPRFSYCGSIAPLAVSQLEQSAWRRLGDVLLKWSGLQGLFGIDAIVRDGVPWVIEVNPRYTASVEVIEYSKPSPPSPLPQSRERGEMNLPSSNPFPKRRGELILLPSPPASGGEGMGVRGETVAKAIYYAPHTLTFPQNGPWDSSIRNAHPFHVPEFADIPIAGSTIRRGRPVMTIFGQDESELRRKVRDLDSIFQVEHVPCR